jgi:hypothetical protein
MKAQIATDHKVEFFLSGLKAAGYKADMAEIHDPKKDDILVVWNRKPSNIDKVTRFEAAGARVIIAENGYIGHADDGARLISLALWHHLGKGWWYVGDEKRYLKHHISVQPWRDGGREIVILAQRGIGEATDQTWAEELCRKLQKMTSRPVRVRAHPGKDPHPLEPDLDDAHAVVTYASGAAIKAIAYGVPCFYMMPDWIGAPAAVFGVDDLECPYKGDRRKMFHRIGWAQWTPDEISSGEAFKGLLKL